MGINTDKKMKVSGMNSSNSTIDGYRRLVQNYLKLVSKNHNDLKIKPKAH